MSVKSLREWLSEGEALYNQARTEYQELENQLEQLERAVHAKRAEVNQIASVIGKPPVESARRVSAEIVESESIPSVMGTVTRALTGRGLGRA